MAWRLSTLIRIVAGIHVVVVVVVVIAIALALALALAVAVAVAVAVVVVTTFACNSSRTRLNSSCDATRAALLNSGQTAPASIDCGSRKTSFQRFN